jgi:hypothetical protein
MSGARSSRFIISVHPNHEGDRTRVHRVTHDPIGPSLHDDLPTLPLEFHDWRGEGVLAHGQRDQRPAPGEEDEAKRRDSEPCLAK